MSATASNSTTYGNTTATGRRSLAGAVLACALGVLQGCSGADAVAPETVASVPHVPQPSAVLASEILAIETDTLVAGVRFVVRGAHLPTTLGSIQVTVAGHSATVMAQTTDRLEAQVERGVLPCAPVALQPVVVQVAGRTFEAARAVRTAARVAPDAANGAMSLAAADAACMELVPSADSGSRYVLSVVNPEADASPAHFELRGIGDGSAVAGVRRAAVAVRETEASTEHQADDHFRQHGRQLGVQAQLVAGAPSAHAAWSLPVRASLKAAVRAPVRAVGDTVSLRALVSGCEAGPEVRARVVYAGSRGVVLEDVRAPRVGRMDAIYAQIGEEFDRVMYPLMLREVGNPLALDAAMHGDGRVTLLFTRVVNDSMPGTAGFVSACNFYPRSTFAGSNEAALLHARVPAATESPADWHRSIRSTVVHETKHLASYAERMARGRVFEEVWLEEATARAAEELYARSFMRGAGGSMTYAQTVGCEITQCDDRPLVMFRHFSALHDFLRRVDAVPALGGHTLNAMTYASGWAFVRWLLDGQADERATLRAMVAGESGRGLEGLSVLTGHDARTLVTDWMASLSTALRQDATADVTRHTDTWNLREIMAGMAQHLPGAYRASPLSVTSIRLGDADKVHMPAHMHEVLPMTTHYIAVDATPRDGSLLSLTMPSGTEVLRLAITRVR